MGGAQATDGGQPAGEPEILDIREGMYVKAGQTLFSIANTGRVWAELAVFTSDLGQIHPGDRVRIYRDGDPADVIEGKIGLIPPYRHAGEKTTAVRIYLKQLPPDWKINTLIHAQIMVSGPGRKMKVPLSAVNRLGMENVVWVQDINHPTVFHAREVETGIQTMDSIQITGGLHRGDKIAENAAYMVAHESFVQ
jgi:Cu(I)/Ag(I) efflux system membrane fusion protein